MKDRLSVLVAVVLLATAFFYTIPLGSAQDASLTYKLFSKEDGAFSFTLNVVVPVSLYTYYQGLSHKSVSEPDFPKFVTPYAVKPLADYLRQIYPDDEEFANGILTLVHQIPYEETARQYYPVETLLRGKGDCDMFSLLAASIMEAGGLDVTLLHYTKQEHMNLGVHLNTLPKDARMEIYSFNRNSETYYVAECTSSDWQKGWRVGECPDDLKDASMIIIPLENSEQMAPGQVSASFERIQPTVLKLGVYPVLATQGATVTVNGQITPSLPNKNVTLYVNGIGSSWKVLATTFTTANGAFSYIWQSDGIGVIGLRASWNGNNQYAGTSSETQSLLILPFYFILLATAAISAVGICMVLFASSKKSRNTKNNLEVATAL